MKIRKGSKFYNILPAIRQRPCLISKNNREGRKRFKSDKMRVTCREPILFTKRYGTHIERSVKQVFKIRTISVHQGKC